MKTGRHNFGLSFLPGCDHNNIINFVAVLISLLMPENMDAMVEASRVFGNFSRSKEVRALLAEHKGKSGFIINNVFYDIN